MDKISNLIINIKNSGRAGKEYAYVPFSKYKMEIVDVLKKEGLIVSASKKGKKPAKTIEIGILYNKDGSPKVNDVTRISKPSKRIYMGSKDIKIFKGGKGVLILSTPKGILTGKEAKKENVGGEALFKIW
ncbi:30S ribosomal protein S8 [Patescibacteria group bacterium]|nr:30S ribosomal protein S8 [Patescibacteria group bacterium]